MISTATRRTSPATRIRRLSDQAVETADVDGLLAVLTRSLPSALGVAETTLLLWNRRLDTFEVLTPGETRRKRVRPEDSAGVAAPETRWLLADGMLLETRGEGDGVLVPLMARSGLVGVLVLGPRRRRRDPPLRTAEVRALQDLASRVALSLENRLYHKELIESERMAALGTMAGMLAHDLRSPMTVIRGYAETLLDGHATPEQVKARAELIVQMVDRLERMTRETLDFARGGGRLALRPLTLHAFLDELIGGLRTELPALEIVEGPRPDDVPFAVDVDKLRRVVGNMAANAHEAMKGKGRLHIVATIEDRPAAAASLGRDVVLAIEDEGPGVPDEVRSRIFDPFVTHGKRGGTGLGLAVARSFVEDHGGSVELLPQQPAGPDPRGARFRIRLPLHPGT